MYATTTITKSGQITLGKQFRDALGVKPGDKITIRKNQNGGITIERRLSDEEFLEQLDNIHAFYNHGKKSLDSTDAVAAVRSYRDGKNATINAYYQEKYL